MTITKAWLKSWLMSWWIKKKKSKKPTKKTHPRWGVWRILRVCHRSAVFQRRGEDRGALQTYWYVSTRGVIYMYLYHRTSNITHYSGCSDEKHPMSQMIPPFRWVQPLIDPSKIQCSPWAPVISDLDLRCTSAVQWREDNVKGCGKLSSYLSVRYANLMNIDQIRRIIY